MAMVPFRGHLCHLLRISIYREDFTKIKSGLCTDSKRLTTDSEEMGAGAGSAPELSALRDVTAQLSADNSG